MSLRRAGGVLTVVVLGAVVAGLGAAWLAGWRINVIESESMAPTLHRNSVALVTPVPGAHVGVGDVIAFRDRSRDGLRVIHRVVDVHDQGQGRFFETRGDANATADGWLVPATAVEGRLGWRLSHVGALTRALAPPRGAVVLVGLPLVLGLFGEVRARRRPRTSCAECGSRADDGPLLDERVAPSWTTVAVGDVHVAVGLDGAPLAAGWI